MTLEIGTVFRWDNSPFPHYGTEKKARWFIYLGETGYLSETTTAYICTTTTKIKDFERGFRRSHGYIPFKAETTPFDDDCALDLDDPPYTPRKNELESNKDIQIKGKLDQEIMRMIYSRLLQSSAYSKIILMDLHESFNRAGIIGLKKPK